MQTYTKQLPTVKFHLNSRFSLKNYRGIIFLTTVTEGENTPCRVAREHNFSTSDAWRFHTVGSLGIVHTAHILVCRVELN